MISESTAIQPAPESIFDITGAERKIREWEEMKKRVLTKDDTQKIGQGTHIKRSGVRKLALAANVATSIMETKTEYEGGWTPQNSEGDFTAIVKAKALASWGRWAEDVGVYSASEFVDKNGNRLAISRHNVIARAATRALNRATLDLIGGGAVSAEELSSDIPETPPQDQSGLEEIEYALRDYSQLVKVEEKLDEYRVTYGSLNNDEYNVIKAILQGMGFKYVPQSDGGPAFTRHK